MFDTELEKRARERLGTTLNGRYRLDALIGMGGMAAVYRASHRNRAQLAVKMLHAELSMNLEVRARFLREGYAANSVQHPGAVLVTDDDVAEDGSAFLVMELLDGASVEELWGRFDNKMPAALAIDIALQTLDVVAAAHAAGVIHRDIKPANLFVTRAGLLKVLDFGIARVLDVGTGAPSATGAGMPIGTPTFMAPEQALARSVDVGACTDVWAVGATLFALLSGEPVHHAATAAETLVHAATRPARSLAEVAPHVPKSVVVAVDRALAFEPKDRWASALAMYDGLAAAWSEGADAARSKRSLASLFPPRRSVAPEAKASTSGPEFASAPTVSAPELPAAAPSRHVAVDAGVTELPVSSSPKTTPAPRGKRRWAWGLACAAVVAVGGVAFVWTAGGRGRPSTSSVGPTPSSSGVAAELRGATLVLIVPSQNLTGEPRFDGAIDVVLESALKRSQHLYPYGGPSMRNLVNDVGAGLGGHELELGRAIAEKRHLRVVVVHLVASVENTVYAISLVARDGVTGTEVADRVQRAPSLDHVVAAVASLGCELRSALGDVCDRASDERVGVSSSIDADHFYARGRDALSTGRHEDAVNVLDKAIQFDPGFAQAHHVRGISLANLGRAEEARDELKAATAHLDGLAPREALEIRAMSHLLSDEFDEVADAYNELLKNWPADTHVRGNLSEDYLAMGKVDQALATLRQEIQEAPNRPHLRANLLLALLVAGHVEEADRETVALLAAVPHPIEGTYLCGALAKVLEGRPQEARAFVERLRNESPSLAAELEADMAMFEGRLEDAVSTLKAAIVADEQAKATTYAENKWAMLGEAYARLGDAAHARDAASRAAKSNDLVLLLQAARVLARAGSATEASTLARIIAAHPGMRAPVFARIVSADVLVAQHATKEAVTRAMGDPGMGPASWLGHADLGEAYVELGAFEEAERELRRAVDARGAGASVFYSGSATLRYSPPVRYWLARALEGLHRPDARDAFQAFVDMEPDSRDPLAVDARKRLAGR